MKNKIKRFAAVLLIVCVIFYLYLQINIIINQSAYSPVKSDAILVLGHSLEGEDEKPDAWLVERLSEGLRLYNEGYGEYIIVSGGKGHDYNISVAYSMRNWLIRQGVAEEFILMDESASNTNENFYYAKKIADDYDIDSVIVVTNDFHIFRSMMISRHYFDSASGSRASVRMSPDKILAYAKEPLSIIKYYVSDRFIKGYLLTVY